MTIYYLFCLSLLLACIMVSFFLGYRWHKWRFMNKHFIQIHEKLEKFIQGNDVVFLEDDKIAVKDPGDALVIEDSDGEIGLFVLIKKFRRKNNG